MHGMAHGRVLCLSRQGSTRSAASCTATCVTLAVHSKFSWTPPPRSRMRCTTCALACSEPCSCALTCNPPQTLLHCKHKQHMKCPPDLPSLPQTNMGPTCWRTKRLEALQSIDLPQLTHVRHQRSPSTRWALTTTGHAWSYKYPS
jgi:hypothetical protein